VAVPAVVRGGTHAKPDAGPAELDRTKDVEEELEKLRRELRAANKHLPQGVSAEDVPDSDGPFVRAA